MRSCESLTEVDISENPIGLVGAKGLLQLNLTEGDRVLVDIKGIISFKILYIDLLKGCSLKINDSSCWFDSDHMVNEFELHLNRPYERAICAEILRMVTHRDEYEILHYIYKESPDDSNGEELKFVFKSVTQSRAVNIQNKRSDDAIDSNSDEILFQIASDIEGAKTVYQTSIKNLMNQYDTNQSEGLDKTELIVLLHQLGLKSSIPVVNELMKQYDVDKSGIIEEEEFILFLENLKDKKEHNEAMNRRSILLLESDANKNSDKSYIPPNQGPCYIIYDIIIILQKVLSN